MLACFVNEYHDDWDLYLDAVAFAYNTSVHESTKFSPFEVIYGHRVNYPGERLDAPTHVGSFNEYIEDLRTRLLHIRELTRQANDAARRKMKRNYNSKRKNKTYSIGQLVLIRNKRFIRGLSRSLTKKFIGPFKIVQIYNQLTAKIQQIGGDWSGVVHVNRLRPYNGQLMEVPKVGSVSEEYAESIEPNNYSMPNVTRYGRVSKPPDRFI